MKETDRNKNMRKYPGTVGKHVAKQWNIVGKTWNNIGHIWTNVGKPMGKMGKYENMGKLRKHPGNHRLGGQVHCGFIP